MVLDLFSILTVVYMLMYKDDQFSSVQSSRSVVSDSL